MLDEKTHADEIDRLRRDVSELRASRRRLAVAADADRRELERNLHDGLQQHLVAISITLQLARQALEAGSAADATTLLGEAERTVGQAVADAARLAEQIRPPLLEAGGLAAALRSAAANAGVRASIEVEQGVSWSPEMADAVYRSCLDALHHAGEGARASIVVATQEAVVTFEVLAERTGQADDTERLRDRVEAAGGTVTVREEPGLGLRISGSIPR